MPETVPVLFGEFAQLANAEGAVPDDGSGVDGIWTTTVPARGRDDKNWHIALNADTGQERVATDFPDEGDESSIPPGRAVVYLGGWPAGIVGPDGGEIVVEVLDDGPQSLEDELIGDVQAMRATLEEADSA